MINYNKSNDQLMRAYFQWKKETPENNHHSCRSFVAGWNACVAALKQMAEENEET